MSWTDKQIIKVIKYLRDKYHISTFVETGTFCGINARLHSKNFEKVFTCEIVPEYYCKALKNLNKCDNVIIENCSSPHFLNKLSINEYIFYLDAHFYNPELPKEKRFVVLEELDNMKKFKDSIIIIHDFNYCLGGITYDNIDLNLDLIKNHLYRINKNFYLYTNKLNSINPVKPNAQDIIDAGLEVDFDTLDNINHVWSSPERLYRGVLYCLPSKLTKQEQKELGLIEIKC